MEALISPEFNVRAFCDAMRGKDPLQIMDAAGAEAASALRYHCKTTKQSNFRKGSKGRSYRDSLGMLIFMLMNGSVPDGATQTFLSDVKPLFVQLLQKWEIGTLRQVFSEVPQPEQVQSPSTIDPLIVVVSKAEVEAMDTSAILAVLKRLIESPEAAKSFVERVDVAFHGYDQTSEELFEIVPVRNFVYELDEQFPFWLFFLSKRHLGLQCLLYCFLPPFLTDEARSRIFPQRIDQLLTQRWLPAMNHICKYADFTEGQMKTLTERAMRYITTGRFSLYEEPFG